MLVTAAAAGLMYRAPASVISSGDELTAVSWALASRLGQGTWEFFPMTFRISTENGETSSVISGCITAEPPGDRLPEGIPFPVEYSSSGDTVTVIFAEVPR